MAASETGGDSLALVDMQNPPAPTQSPANPAAQNLGSTNSADGTAVHNPVSGSSPPSQPGGFGGAAYVVHNVNSGDLQKRKRGRPRKYGPDGTMTMALVHVAAMPQPSVAAAPPSGTFSPSVPPPSAPAPPPPPTVIPPPPAKPSSPPSSDKKARGTSPGSSKTQEGTEALGSAGMDYKPHGVIVGTGEDISAKIMSFALNGPRAISITSAIGAVSNATIRHPARSGATTTYEGIFDILSLCGSFMPSEVAGQRSWTGGLRVILHGSDGQLLFGPVAGPLIAASPVQIMAATFLPDGGKDSKSENRMELFSHAISVNPAGAAGPGSPPSRGPCSESSGVPGAGEKQSLV